MSALVGYLKKNTGLSKVCQALVSLPEYLVGNVLLRFIIYYDICIIPESKLSGMHHISRSVELNLYFFL